MIIKTIVIIFLLLNQFFVKGKRIASFAGTKWLLFLLVYLLSDVSDLSDGGR